MVANNSIIDYSQTETNSDIYKNVWLQACNDYGRTYTSRTKGVATGLKVGGSNFFRTPHIFKDPHFLGGSFQNVGGPEKFFYTVV